MRIKYISVGEPSHFYEVNKTKELIEGVILQIEKLVPAIRFEGHMIYPKRINEYKIFVTESPSELSPESVRADHPEGYDFGGDDVTLEIITQAPKPIYHCQECDAIVNPTDEKCPNGHDLSIVGKAIKLTLTERLTLSDSAEVSTLSDSIDLTSGFVVDAIENIVPGPKTPEIQKEIDSVKNVLDARNEETLNISENLDKEKTLTLRMRYASGIAGLFLFLVGTYSVSLNVSVAYVPCFLTGAFLFLLSIRPESITGSIKLGTK